MTRQKEPLLRRLRNAVLVAVFLPLILPLAVVAVSLNLLHKVTLYLLVWLVWLPKGKDILFVYSDSPIWHEYMTTQVLPLVRERAVVLNWSERSQWLRWSFRVHVFHSFGGGREFNPLVVVFRPFRRAKVLRFWMAFQDWKRGYKEPVERLCQEMFSALQHEA